MSETIVIAEINNGVIADVTAELVSAVIAFGGSPTIVVPCVDSSIAVSWIRRRRTSDCL